jgi:uncharacterized DUF497 family protein
LHDYRFQWDEYKNEANIKKHSISFNEAWMVFSDVNAVVIADEDHSYLEDRFLVIGFDGKSRLLVVCHCYRESETVIRIISARKADNEERKIYRGKGGRR